MALYLMNNFWTKISLRLHSQVNILGQYKNLTMYFITWTTWICVLTQNRCKSNLLFILYSIFQRYSDVCMHNIYNIKMCTQVNFSNGQYAFFFGWFIQNFGKSINFILIQYIKKSKWTPYFDQRDNIHFQLISIDVL